MENNSPPHSSPNQLIGTLKHGQVSNGLQSAFAFAVGIMLCSSLANIRANMELGSLRNKVDLELSHCQVRQGNNNTYLQVKNFCPPTFKVTQSFRSDLFI